VKKKYRLLKNYQFEELIIKGKVMSNREFFIYYFNRNDEDTIKIGISVPKKKFNKAFIRNKIKRQIKHILVDIEKNLPINIVIIVKKKYLDNNYKNNRFSLYSLLNKVLVMKEEIE